jgi:hypothetical protein
MASWGSTVAVGTRVGGAGGCAAASVWGMAKAIPPARRATPGLLISLSDEDLCDDDNDVVPGAASVGARKRSPA